VLRFTDIQKPIQTKIFVMHKTSWLKFIIGIVLLNVVGVSTAAESIASKISREINQSNSRQVLRKYYDTPLWVNTMVPGIKTAEDEWLKVAEQLQRGADAAAGEDLDSALYAALPIRPFAVLRVLGKHYKRRMSYLCQVSFEAEIPEGGALPYLERVRHALDSASTKQQKAIATECKNGLDKSRAAAIAQGLH
jgi:hypothetical protein